MNKIAEDPDTQRWWKLTDGMQESFVEGAEGSGKEISWWTVSSVISDLILLTATISLKTLPEVFRFEGKA